MNTVDSISPNEQSVQSPSVIHIQASPGWASLKLAELWEYRELLWFLTLRDIKGRYRQMALGSLWIVIQPIVNTVIFSLIFGGLAGLPSEDIPYPIFTFTALLPWTYFTQATTTASTSLVTRMNVISKVYFPRLIIPITGVLSGLVDMGMSFLVLIGMILFYKVPLTLNILFLPAFILLTALTALSIGLWTATIAVRFRDLQYAISYALRIGVYLTPVAYSATLIPERWILLYKMNPLYWVIEGFRWAILGGGTSPQLLMLIPVGIVLVLLVTGAYVFRRTELTVVDWL